MLKKFSLLMATATMSAFVGMTLIANPVSGQEQQAAGGNGGMVVTLDLAKVFDLHPGHNAKIKSIESRAEQMKQDFQKQQLDLQNQVKEAAAQFQGAKLDEMEVQLRQQEVALQTKARQAQTELMKSEADAYFQTYEQVMGEVRNLCQEYNIALVLRSDNEPIDPSNPGTVIRGVQRSVVYAAVDLTPHVLNKLGIDPAAQTSTAAQATGTQQR